MKKAVVLVFIICGILGVGAQTVDDSWKKHSRHELTMGFSDPLPQTFICQTFHPILPQAWATSDSKPQNWFVTDSYISRYGITAPITLTYKYRAAKWLWVGASVSYFGIYSSFRDRFTDQVIAHSNTNMVNISPVLQFSWLNRKYITLYSGISGGLSLIFGKNFSQETEQVTQDTYLFGNFQLTAIGIKAGKKWFGFAEVGIGSQSFVTAGVGYRFNEND